MEAINPLKQLTSLNNPHLFFINIGLSKELYEKTQKIEHAFKKLLANIIITKASHDQILLIIYKLSMLEFQCETSSPFRTGNRLAATLIAEYTKRIERDRFTRHYFKQGTAGNFKIDARIKDLWATIRKAAKQSLTKTQFERFTETIYKKMPLFYYSQIIALSNYKRKIKKYPTLSRDTSWQEHFTESLSDITSPVKIDSQQSFLTERLLKIEQIIRGRHWQVGSCITFYASGVKNQGQTVPHRINDILNLVDSAVKKGEIPLESAYWQIVDKASEALNKPRWFQAESTKEAYRQIMGDHLSYESPLESRLSLAA